MAYRSAELYILAILLYQTEMMAVQSINAVKCESSPSLEHGGSGTQAGHYTQKERGGGERGGREGEVGGVCASFLLLINIIQ